MRPARVALALMLIAAASMATSAIAELIEPAHYDECAAEEHASSDCNDGCPECPPDCDDECVCCSRVPADVVARVGLVTLPFERVRYARSADAAPASVELQQRDPVPRARG